MEMSLVAGWGGGRIPVVVVVAWGEGRIPDVVAWVGRRG